MTILDIRDHPAASALITEVQPSIVINTAFQQADWASTADGGATVAVAAWRAGARLVHISSDAVFSGAAVSYRESDAPDPITPYGAAKATQAHLNTRLRGAREFLA